jgi:hypothetical protein
VDWIHLAEDRFHPRVGPCEHDNESLGSIKAGNLLIN